MISPLQQNPYNPFLPALQTSSARFGAKKTKEVDLTPPPVIQAADAGKNDKMMQILNEDPKQLKATDIKGQSLFAHLMAHKNLQGLQQVLNFAQEQGINLKKLINKRDEDNYTLLAWAVELGNLKIVEMFHQLGGKLRVPASEKDFNSPHQLANINGWPKIAAYINEQLSKQK